MPQAFITKIKPFPIQPETIKVIQLVGKNIANEINALNLGISYGSRLEILKNKVLLLSAKNISLIGVVKDKVILTEDETIFVPLKTAEKIHLPDKVVGRVTIIGKAIIPQGENNDNKIN